MADYLIRRTLLLALDNFEHILEAAPAVAGLLRAAPLLRVLVTSRQPLHFPGEHELAVGPMTLPEGATTVTALAGCEAVRLFVERSAAVRPGFTVTAENAGDVREICKHLDGIPRAIELAASRLKVLSPRALARKLIDSLAFLKDDSSGLPPPADPGPYYRVELRPAVGS